MFNCHNKAIPILLLNLWFSTDAFLYKLAKIPMGLLSWFILCLYLSHRCRGVSSESTGWSLGDLHTGVPCPRSLRQLLDAPVADPVPAT